MSRLLSICVVLLVLGVATPSMACGRGEGQQHGLFTRLREWRIARLHRLIGDEKTEARDAVESAPKAPVNSACSSGRCRVR